MTTTAVRPAKLWMPKRVLFTPAALEEPWGRQIHERVAGLGLPIVELASNRVTGIRGETERETYAKAKSTLAVTVAPPGKLKLQPIPPSADWQFHLAEGCPAHCQYCYLAGSLQGPPITRVYANLPAILDATRAYGQSFEASCYTDPLGIEHLTGGLAETIRHFGTRPDAHLRWTTKFDAVDELLDLPHNGRTRPRFSVNATAITTRFEGGTVALPRRLEAARRVAGAGYPIGFVIAPIIAFDGWYSGYDELLDDIASTLGDATHTIDLTFELITHRFTPGSRDVLTSWYPKTKLEMDPEQRSQKRNKFGGVKHVYPKQTMHELRAFFEQGIARRFPRARVLYWT